MTSTLATRLTESATHHQGAQAAIWLLDQHGYWLPVLEQHELIAREYTNPDATNDCSIGRFIQYGQALDAHLGTDEQQQVLRIAAALADEASTYFDADTDEPTRRLVLHAIAWATGGREWADSLRLLTACSCAAEPVHQAGCDAAEVQR